MNVSIKKSKVSIGMVLAGIVYGLSDTLLEFLSGLLHTSFELFELVLDKSVEHIFHTDLHTTQLITFYLMLLIAAIILYLLGCRVPGWLYAIKNNLAGIAHQRTEEFLSYWRTSSAINKMKWWAVLAVGTGLMAIGLFS